MRWQTAIVPLLLLSSPAYSQPKEGPYYCVVEWVGGGWYNPTTKKWEGSEFNPDSERYISKFIVTIKVVGRHTEQSAPHQTRQFDDYNVTIKPSTFNRRPLDCLAGFATGWLDDNRSKVISTRSESSIIRCNVVDDYVFNLNTNRFLQVATTGFTSGRDDDANTPSISGGTCIKIE